MLFILNWLRSVELCCQLPAGFGPFFLRLAMQLRLSWACARCALIIAYEFLVGLVKQSSRCC